jgi:hypothetical protein
VSSTIDTLGVQYSGKPSCCHPVSDPRPLRTAGSSTSVGHSVHFGAGLTVAACHRTARSVQSRQHAGAVRPCKFHGPAVAGPRVSGRKLQEDDTVKDPLLTFTTRELGLPFYLVLVPLPASIGGRAATTASEESGRQCGRSRCTGQRVTPTGCNIERREASESTRNPPGRWHATRADAASVSAC